MFHLLAARTLAGLTTIGVLGVSSAFAQAPTPITTAAVPAVNERTAIAPFRSALEGYQRFDEEPLRPWKESNDTVGGIGGWKAYAREAQGGGTGAGTGTETRSGSGAAIRTPAPAVADPHAGHGGKAK